MTAPSLSKLNPPQAEAVRTLSGPLLVLAGAGTGKTRVITYRIVQLIRSGIAPERILAMTFTNKAAREMQERATALLGRRQETRPEISTFHSLCVRVLRRRIQLLGYPQRFVIYDRGDQESLARSTLRELKVAGETLRPGDLLGAIGGWKNQSIAPELAEHQAHSDKDFLTARAYRRYQEGLRARGAVDFDDLLLLTRQVFDEFPEVAAEESGRFDHILVDEYQDTNGPQYRILRSLALPHRNLCVVGDDDQSIYGWRGAEVRHILGFDQDWPEAKVVRLEDNYRSSPAILELSNRLIAHNRTRHEKVLRANLRGGPAPRFAVFPDEEHEARGVVRDIEARLAEPHAKPEDIAILFRTNEQPRAFELELRKKDIPYRLVGGMSFWDRREVRDVMAYLKLLVAPQDEASLLRIINTPARGLGKTILKRLVDRAVAAGASVWDVMLQPATLEGMTTPTRRSLRAFVELIERARGELESRPLARSVRTLLDEIGYRAEIDRQYDEPLDRDARWNAVEEVVNAVAQYEDRAGRDLAGFLQEATIAERDDEDKKKQHCVTLMTLHSAKGLEFPQVYLVGMEEGMLPHERSVDGDVDEERRLCYVGVTRAQERITLTLAEKRRKWGTARERTPSRFLYEMADLSDHRKLGAMRDRGSSRPATRKKSSRGRAPIRRAKSKSKKTGRRIEQRR